MAPRIPPLTPVERETVIIFNDEDDVALVSTHQRSVLGKLRRNPAAREVEDLSIGRNPGAQFEIDKRHVYFRRPKK